VDVSWKAGFEGLRGFNKLLALPLAAWYFMRSENTHKILLAFAFSVLALLAFSWVTYFIPSLTFGGRVRGVPVKDYIFQNYILSLALCVLLYGFLRFLAAARYQAAAWAGLILANLVFVAISRTALFVLPFLVGLVSYQVMGRKGPLLTVAALCAVGVAGWVVSPYFQSRVSQIVHSPRVVTPGTESSEALRLELWRRSLVLVRAAPLFGHGTGSTTKPFLRIETSGEDAMLIKDNPHNQVLMVGVQLGLVGIALLLAMWFAHARLFFSGATWPHHVGQVIVAQNVISSVFNSHIADFTAGWIYVLGVGAFLGLVLKGAPLADPRDLEGT
jgi:O-antigen ligase